jgi:translation elongation factor EF-1beta
MEMMKEYIKNAHPEDQKVKDMQEMLALLRRRPSTKITFDEMNAIIKQKQIAKYKAELAAKQPIKFIHQAMPKILLLSIPLLMLQFPMPKQKNSICLWLYLL